jgi:hypothetical protein
MHFLDEALFLNMTLIDDVPFVEDTHVVLNILSSCVTGQPSYFTWTIPTSYSFLFFLVGFDRRIM